MNKNESVMGDLSKLRKHGIVGRPAHIVPETKSTELVGGLPHITPEPKKLKLIPRAKKAIA